MKYLQHTLVLIFSFIILSVGAQDTAINLTGKWEDKNLKVSYEFNPDGSIMFYQSGYGVLINSYTLDLSKDPGWIDFTMKNSRMTIVTNSLIRIIDENTMWIEQTTSSSEHPTSFSDPEGDGKYRIHVLKKVSDN